MTALRFQTGEGHQTSLASLEGHTQSSPTEQNTIDSPGKCWSAVRICLALSHMFIHIIVTTHCKTQLLTGRQFSNCHGPSPWFAMDYSSGDSRWSQGGGTGVGGWVGRCCHVTNICLKRMNWNVHVRIKGEQSRTMRKTRWDSSKKGRQPQRDESGAANKRHHSSVMPLLLLYEAFFSYLSLQLSLYLWQTAHSHINTLSDHQLYHPGFH